ncbi:alpha/beta hydrolase [Bizionia paragorgiae]|uniref:alpha/beta hydrolase n=1 Tax=Bizionia paragorgiae TaxID=283786 RepID=UPI00299EA2F4|nr:alpha/beta hydrolase [Bizionia paragorgiae]MDX1270705.1 alpha/beta hydrolase [Bizionia paragorgiae]
MNQEIIHVYLLPGMAANPSIFDNIALPKEQFELHKLHWIIPLDNETLEAYALRIIKDIKHENIVLLGVSFGGVLVQEMIKHIKVRKLFVVSSVKTKNEMPRRFKVLRATKAYKILPTQLLGNIDLLAKFAFGETVTKRVELYKKYLSVNDKKYLDWAIEQMVCWDQEEPVPEAIHIHGDADLVFPHHYLGDCITIKGGTHIMIINKYKWFNENLPKLILG